jgi:hypothetical protein
LAAFLFAGFSLALVLARPELAGQGCGCIGISVLEFQVLWANVARNAVLVLVCLALGQAWQARLT